MKKIPIKMVGFASLILFGIIAAFAPVDHMASENSGHGNHGLQIAGLTDYVSAEEISHLLIDKDPSLIVVDLRSSVDYNKYNIPGSINIPVLEILNEELDNEMTIVLASNGNTIAAQGWQILKNGGYSDVLILQGGLNHWVKTYTDLKIPNDAALDDEIFMYQFKKSAGPVMMGTQSQVESSGDQKPAAKPVPRIRKKKKKKTDDGC